MQLSTLTDLKVRQISNSTSSRVEVRDPAEKGLYLVVQPSGAKSFVWRSKSNGRKMRVGLGSYPTVTLADARSRARELAREKSQGIDPVAVRKARRDAAKAALERQRAQNMLPVAERGDTLRALANEWLRRVHDEPGLRQAKETRRYVTKYLAPLIDRQPSSITRQEVVQLVARIEESNGPTTAHHTLKVIKAIYNWAIERGWSGDGEAIDRNPADKLRSPRSPRESARTRRLTDNEIVAFWRACDEETGLHGLAFQLLLLTSQRRTEVLGAKWSEFNFERGEWLIPASRMKMGCEHLIRLTPQIIAHLSRIPRITGCDQLFPNKRSLERPISGDSRAKARIQCRMAVSAGSAPHWVLHDIRRTCATELQRQGFRAEVIEAVQSRDAATGTAAHYHLYGFADEKFAALAGWNERVQFLIQDYTHSIGINE